MKKVLFSVLMFSAMFMIASCGSKSTSGEAAAEAEDENVAEVEFTDPAIQSSNDFGGSTWFDLSDYLTAESVTPPSMVPGKKNSSINHKQISTNVVLKLAKKIDTSLFTDDDPWAYAKVEFCDKNGTCLIKSDWESCNQVFGFEAGKTIGLNFLTEEKHEREYKELLPQIKKVRILVKASVGDKATEE